MFDQVIGTFAQFILQFRSTAYLHGTPHETGRGQISSSSVESGKYLPKAPNICRLFPGQLKACTSWRLSTSIIAPPSPPKRPIFSTSMSLCYLYLSLCQGSFFDRCLLSGCTHSHAHHHPCVPVLPPPVCGSMSGSKSQESLDSFPTGPD